MSSPANQNPSVTVVVGGSDEESPRLYSSYDDCFDTNNENSSISSSHIPEASAVLLVDVADTTTVHMQPIHVVSAASALPNSSYSTAGSSSSSQYVSAQVLGSETTISRSRRRIRVANTSAEAVPLDPWSNKPTTSSALMTSDSGAPSNGNDSSYNRRSNTPLQLQPFADVSETEQLHPHERDVTHTNQHQEMRRYHLLTAIQEDPFHKKCRRRRRRRGRMMVGGITGFVFGTFVLGPIGGVAGATAGAVLARTASKVGEKRKDVRVQRERNRYETEQHQHEENYSVNDYPSSAERNSPPIQEAYATADPIERYNNGSRSRRSGRYRHSRSSRTR